MQLLGLERDGSGTPFLWLHGFTQTKASAHRFRSILAGQLELLTLDLPGHGENASRRASLVEIADLLADSLPDGPLAVGGYSFGARVALHLALGHPERVTRLVLLGASRGLASDAERQARRSRDEDWAALIERDGTSSFLSAWLAQPLFATLTPEATESNARSQHAPGLANSLRDAGTGTQVFLQPRLKDVRATTLTMAGAYDVKFTHEAEAIARGIPNARVAVIANAGHAAHLEQPEACAAEVLSFLR
ncbi:MAG TPA: alpha/beta fold hydrolase [Acidimicrobiales bacterium]|jgi:2-succinyl-6-hydroxy-2,4-cyclohexadiene-1-carboxylate synthase